MTSSLAKKYLFELYTVVKMSVDQSIRAFLDSQSFQSRT